MTKQLVIFAELGHPPEPVKGYGSGIRKKKQPYAAEPGTGPDGETCRTCKHKYRARWATKHILKCALMESAWTHGKATDIKAASPACSKWEGKE